MTNLLIPIITFFVGFIANTLYRHFNEKKKLERLRFYYLFWTEQNLKSLNRLNKLNEQFILKLNSTTHIEGPSLNRIKLTLKKLSSLDQTNLMKAFVLSSAEKEDYISDLFYKISSKIDFIDSNLQSTNEIFEKFQERVSEIRSEWNKKIKLLNNLKTELLSVGIENIKSDALLLLVNSSFEKWYQHREEATNIYLTNKVFLLPLEDQLQVYYQKDTADDRVIRLLSAIQTIQTTIKEFNEFKKGYLKLFQHNFELLKKTQKELFEIINKLRIAKYKWWVPID